MPRHYDDGFHTTGTCGALGARQHARRLRGLNASQTTYALGMAATEGGGLRDNFGSMTKPFQAGRAAENGTVAAELAALGWTAAHNLEARWVFPGGGWRLRSRRDLAARQALDLGSPGVSIKPHPSGS